MPALIPPGAAHIDGVTSLGLPRAAIRGLVRSWLAVTVVACRRLRCSGRPEVQYLVCRLCERLPLLRPAPLSTSLLLRTLRLNCLTTAYADLWATCFDRCGSAMTGGPADSSTRVGADSEPSIRTWTAESPLRRASDRRQALVEIDALVALMLGVDRRRALHDLSNQFPVLYGYDRTPTTTTPTVDWSPTVF